MNKFKMVIGGLLLLVAIHCACMMDHVESTNILTLAFYAVVSALGGGIVLSSVDEDKKRDRAQRFHTFEDAEAREIARKEAEEKREKFLAECRAKKVTSKKTKNSIMESF